MTSEQSSPERPEKTLPSEFLAMISEHPALHDLAEGLLTPPDVSVRINTAKGIIIPEGVSVIPWCDSGFYLPERPPFTFDPALHQGLYYVQDASSMVLDYITRQLTADGIPVRWLDACAAPGGKTTTILSALPEGSTLVANEYVRKRAEALIENLERWGFGNVGITNVDTAAFTQLPDFFDVVSVDAPCSGEGMMRKEDVAITQWSTSLVKQCAKLQREIVSNVWQALRPGGHLIYSTCTFNTEEDERNVLWMMHELGAEPVDINLGSFTGVIGAIEGNIPCGRFLPGKVRGEGLFVAVLRKPATNPAISVKKKLKVRPQNLSGNLKQWFKGDYVVIPDTNHVVTHTSAEDLLRVETAMPLLCAGIHATTQKGRDIIPTYSLAHAKDLEHEAFNKIEVDYQTAIQYLQGNPVNLTDAPRGMVLLTYCGHPLAFAKNIGTRANNLIPDNRRIITKRVPDSSTSFPLSVYRPKIML